MQVLGIGYKRNSLYSCTLQALPDITACFAAMKIKHRALAGLRDHQELKVLGIAIRRNRIKTSGRRQQGGPFADAEGAGWQLGAVGDNPPCRLDRRLGGEDHGIPVARGKLWHHETRRQKRRGDNGCVRKAVKQRLGEAVRLRGGSGQKDNRSAGLCDHGLGVTCEAGFGQRRIMGKGLTFLGIESSCDDTAAAVVRSVRATGEILASEVEGQTALHADFGGVVPEIAARAHAERLDHCVERALAVSGVALDELDGIAVTAGPGLIGGVLSGVMLAKGLAQATGLPLIGINHLAGHALTPRLTDGLSFPYLILLVSGGHSQFLIVHGPERFERLGGTIDDAPGEAFDKVARLLGLPQPGGPSVEAEARLGDPVRFRFPRPLLDRPGCDMSFSGLKTAVLRARDALVTVQGGITIQDRRDICAGFQAAVTAVLAQKSRQALAVYLQVAGDTPAFAVAGGVAANSSIRATLETVCAEFDTRFAAPPLRLCTDNAAMIAWAGIERFRIGTRNEPDLLARPRWPLDDMAPAMIGSGKKGAKA